MTLIVQITFNFETALKKVKRNMSALTEYVVVVNDEEQYSIWPTFKEVPAGWSRVAMTGSKDACLEYIETVWKDITPKSVRESLKQYRENKLH